MKILLKSNLESVDGKCFVEIIHPNKKHWIYLFHYACLARWFIEFWELSGVRASWSFMPRWIMSNTKTTRHSGYSFRKLRPEISRSYKHAAKSRI
jgi:hypothetical protein